MAGRHHSLIARKFEDIASGKIKRLIINMAPRHTKSEFASYLLPSWFLGKNPHKKDMTKVQREVFLIVDEWWKEFGYSPSLRDIAYQRGKSSLPNTMKIVNRLCELGVLKKQTGRGRTIRPVYINFRTLE